MTPDPTRLRRGKRAVRRLCRLLVLMLMVACINVPIDASSQTTADGAIVVGTSGRFPPYAMLDDAGQPYGFAIDIMNAVAARAGLDIRYKIIPKGESVVDALKDGKIDVIASLGISEQRKEIFTYTPTLETARISFFLRQDTKGIDAIDSLYGRKVGVVPPNLTSRILKTHPRIQQVVYADAPSAFFALLSAEIDAFAYTESVAWNIARHAGIADRLKVMKTPLREIHRAMAVRKDAPALASKLNSAVSNLLKSAEYREIYVKWLGSPPRFWTTARFAVIMGFTISVLFIVMLIWRYRSIVSLNQALVRTIEERKKLEDQLRQSQKMEAVGQLTGGIAHDFNNMLGVVMGNIELVSLETTLDAATKTRLDNAFKAALRATELTKKLLGFSRTHAVKTELTSANDIIVNLKDLTMKSLTAAIKVETHLADDLWLTDINPSELEDSLLNLALNARDSMPDGGTLRFETKNKVLGDEYVKLNPGSRAGDFVMIVVSDQGIGMLQEVQDRIFEPFFSTKEQGKGTGLGLSMVYGFVQRSGGHISVYSEPGHGTTFRIFLPRAQAKETEGKKPQRDHPRDLPRGTERILVVDDEEGLLELSSIRLQELGYSVLTATNAEQAIAILKQPPGVDLLFSDVIMPGKVDGYRLARAAIELQPSVKVLLTSGFANRQEEFPEKESALPEKIINDILNKPYNYAELANAVRNTLDKNRS